MPPHLAGRKEQQAEFLRLLEQDRIYENLLLTGLRGVGKTVLLETLKPLAFQNNWLWVGTDLSESASVMEETIAMRLLTDLSVVTSGLVLAESQQQDIGFHREARTVKQSLDYAALRSIFSSTPGMVSDKLKAVLNVAWQAMRAKLPEKRGIIFAYDEAQTMSDHREKEQYPLSMLLDVFQSIQRAGIPFMLALTGLPTLFPKLVEARTYAERMFRVVFLSSLSENASYDAITKPIRENDGPVQFDESSISAIQDRSGGYPYFIQFVCREIYDVWVIRLNSSTEINDLPGVPFDEIIQKLDTDFFAGRWARVTDRQRELLVVIANVESGHTEFSVQELVEKSKGLLARPFSASNVNQMLSSLIKSGMIYKNRHGKYSFAVPLIGDFILRQEPTQE